MAAQQHSKRVSPLLLRAWCRGAVTTAAVFRDHGSLRRGLDAVGGPMQEHITAFTGEWVMDPEASAYTSGPPPRSGHYTLTLDGDSLKVKISGTTAAGEPIDTGYVLDLSGDTSVSAGPVDRVRTIAEPGRL